jgi:hypothetical protein
MFPYPDTLINGTVYKKIQENNDASGTPEFIRNHFVRSDTSGKGYVYIPDSAAEFLTGDLNAQAGDTVHDVLMSYTSETEISYWLTDVIIDSVVTISVSGSQKTRWYTNDYTGTGAIPFWQEGMGTVSGPVLELTGQWWYCCVNDTVQFGSGPCPSWITEVIEPRGAVAPLTVLGPNPSSGLFRLSSEQAHDVTVLNAQGLIVLTGRSSIIDLNGHPSGPYTAVVSTSHGVYTLRILVVR